MVMMLILLTVYFTFFAPETPVTEEPKATTEESIAAQADSVVESAPELATPEADSVRDSALKERFGSFAAVASGEETEVMLENDDMKVSINTRGGFISFVELKNFVTHDGRPLVLIDKQSGSINLTFEGQNRKFNLNDFYFKPSVSSVKVAGNDSLTVTLTATLGAGQYLQHTYSFKGEGYEIGYALETEGLDSYIDNKPAVIEWKNEVKKVEKDIRDARIRTTINYYTTVDEFDYLSATSEGLTEASLGESLKWVAIKQKFFTSGLISSSNFAGGYVATRYAEADTSFVKSALINLSLSGEKWRGDGFEGKWYFGPNDYVPLKRVAPDFDKNIELGWGILGWINKGFTIHVFNFLERFIGSYGLIIILVVILIRIILFPLNYKSYMSMAKMKVLKPEIDEIKEKFPDDMQKQQAETMSLYQKVGINPLSGCIPMLLQMPILFAMFYFFPNYLGLRQESFLWAHDLSTYDSILNLPFTIPFYGDHVSLFTLLMTASTILYTWSNSQMTTVQGPMKTLQYIMPITFLFFLNSYSAGLTYYYFITNILSFGQQAVIKRFVNEDKIKAKLEENRKKNLNKKKSTFQQRLEEAMKANEANRKKK